MTLTPSPKPEGLRVRKKRATENAIENSAVDLALELGVENVTVEMICERADISRSTFFNYFAGRDYAIVGRAIQSLQGEQAAAVLSTSPGNISKGIVLLIFASIGHQHVNTDVARKRSVLNATQPAAQRMASASLVETSVSLIPVVQDWLKNNPEECKLDNPDHEGAMAVALAHAVFSALLLDIDVTDGDVSPDPEAIDRAVEQIRKLVL